MRLLSILTVLFAAACAHAKPPVAVQPHTPAPQPATTVVRAPAAPAPASVTPAAATADADPALWVVKDKDTTIYLFGTIHVLKPGLSWFDEAVKTAFDKSSELRLEMVLPPQAEAQAAAIKLGTTTSGPTLPERLPAAMRPRYFGTLAAYGLPATALDRFTPWFAANNLTILPLVKLGFALDSGAEQVLTRAAKADGKTITGFETLNQQLGYFAGLSDKAQVAYLGGVIDEIDSVGKTVNAMVGEWSKGDPDGLAKLLNDDLDDNPELAKTLLADRNARWADWIAGRLAQPGTVFIAVGAGHLAGAKSVQAMLAAKGIKAERIAY